MLCESYSKVEVKLDSKLWFAKSIASSCSQITSFVGSNVAMYSASVVESDIKS